MNVFTNDQKNRMRYALDKYRDSIEISNACQPVVTMPNVDIKADYTEIPANRYVNFTSTSSEKVSHYLWIFNGAVPDTSNSANPENIWYSKPGRYTVTLVATFNSGDVKVTKYQYILVDTLGNNNQISIKYQYYNSKKDSIYYYYNYNNLVIDFGDYDFYDVTINLYNLMGQKIITYVQSEPFVVGSHKIVLPVALSNNIYILRIHTQNGFINKKLMILH